MSIYTGPNIVTDSLELYVDASNTKSYPGTGTTLTDLSSNGVDMELVNGPTFDSANGGSILHDGTDDLIRTDETALSSYNDYLTIDCWYKGTKSSRNHLWTLGSSTNQLNCNFNDGTYELWMYWNGSGSNRVRYNGNFTDGTIKNLVFVHNVSTNKVFIDGSELSIDESAGTQTFSNIGLTGRFNTGSPAFGGNIYSIKIYRKALSTAEVLQNYRAHRGKF